MMNPVSKIFHFKVLDYPENEHQAVRLGNLLSFLGFTISSLYSLFYFFILDAPKAALSNEFFAFCYLLYFYFLSKGKQFPAYLSIAITYMSQMFYLVVFFASHQSGFQYYYLLVGPVIFFFLKKEQIKIKMGLAITSFIAFLLCEIMADKYSVLVLTEYQFEFLHLSTISIIFILLVIIIYTFQKEIYLREEKLESFANEMSMVNASLNEEIKIRKRVEEILMAEKAKLQDALLEIRNLSGMLPICSNCKKIRDDKGYWKQIEEYIMEHSEAQFSHGICPKCAKELLADS